MKQFFAFLRSMKFGIALLILVMAFSLLGSLVPQGREAGWYTQNLPNVGSFVLAVGLDNVFYGWYFIVLIGLLCINLTLCSLIRFTQVRKNKQNALSLATGTQVWHDISRETADALTAFLLKKGYKRRDSEGLAILYKNMAGYYGSFAVHLSILFTLVFGGLVLGLSKVNDYSIMPGENLTLPDNTQLYVESFRLTDDTGRTDYASIIHVTAPNGAHSAAVEIKVNYPFTFQTHKYYQHSYGTGGSVTATNIQTGGSDVFYLNDRSFLSGDGRNGIWFEALYPGYVEDDDGHLVPIAYMGGAYPDPVYQVLVSNNGQMTSVMARPGDTAEAGDIVFTFNAPISYPGIRVKDIPVPFPALLYVSFVLMILGFWLSFFHTPAVIHLREDGYYLSGTKTAGTQLELDSFFENIP